MEQVNGIYSPMADFAGGEAFQLEVNRDGINKIYIRFRSNDVRNTWVISLSPNSDAGGVHLYKRECEKEQITPPLFGWQPCAAGDGVSERHATQLVQGVPKLKYHYGPLQEINWDCQPPLSGLNARGRTPRQQGISSSLIVCVIGAHNIPETRAHEFHVVCQVPGKSEIVESTPVPARRDPEFKLKAPVRSWKHGDHLEFTLYAERNIPIGQAELDYEHFRESGFVGEVPVTLLGTDSQEVTMGVCITMPGQSTPGFDVAVRKEHGSKIGIEIAPDLQSNALAVTKILEGGLISQWNGDNPEQQVGIRDKIVDIDGVAGSCRALLMQFARNEPRTMRMRILRSGT